MKYVFGKWWDRRLQRTELVYVPYSGTYVMRTRHGGSRR